VAVVVTVAFVAQARQPPRRETQVQMYLRHW
jgi:hypothetical protein